MSRKNLTSKQLTGNAIKFVKEILDFNLNLNIAKCGRLRNYSFMMEYCNITNYMAFF